MRRRDFWRRIFSVEVDPDERHPLVPARLRMHPPHIPRKLLDCFALLVENLNPPVFVCRRTVVSGDAAPSFVFQNDCRGSERGFTSSAATSRVSTASSRGRGSQSPPRHGKRLVMLTATAVFNCPHCPCTHRLPRSGISCVTACPTETGKNILTYRESKQVC